MIKNETLSFPPGYCRHCCGFIYIHTETAILHNPTCNLNPHNTNECACCGVDNIPNMIHVAGCTQPGFFGGQGMPLVGASALQSLSYSRNNTITKTLDGWEIGSGLGSDPKPTPTRKIPIPDDLSSIAYHMKRLNLK